MTFSAFCHGQQNPGVLYYSPLARAVEANLINLSYLAIFSILTCSSGVSTVALVCVLFLLIFIQLTDYIFGILWPSLALSQYLRVYFIFNSNSNSTRQHNHCLCKFFLFKNFTRTEMHFYSESVSPLRSMTSQSWVQKHGAS